MIKHEVTYVFYKEITVEVEKEREAEIYAEDELNAHVSAYIRVSDAFDRKIKV